MIEQYNNFEITVFDGSDRGSTYTPRSTYSKYFGEKTLGENIADNGGVKIGYKAFRNSKHNIEYEFLPTNLNLTPRQLFWVGYAQDHCLIGDAYTNYGDLKELIEKQKQRIHRHAPAPWRVNTVLSNQPEFAEDFRCRRGTKLNMPKEQRCEVW